MKAIVIHRDPGGKLAFRVREAGKTAPPEVSSYTDTRKLRRHLRRTYGKSTRLSGLGT